MRALGSPGSDGAPLRPNGFNPTMGLSVFWTS